jgi:hypothetical protein
MFCASSPVNQVTSGRNRLLISHGPGAAKTSDGVLDAYDNYRQMPEKLASSPLMGVVEIIHMPFVTPIAQRYLHLGNTLKNSLQPK